MDCKQIVPYNAEVGLVQRSELVTKFFAVESQWEHYAVEKIDCPNPNRAIFSVCAALNCSTARIAAFTTSFVSAGRIPWLFGINSMSLFRSETWE
jgi:hypothetical protein